MNWDKFFEQYRLIFGRIKDPRTVAVINTIIEEARRLYNLSDRQIAYVLATAYHETGHDFVPKREYGTAEYFIRKYWQNIKVRNWLGNDSASEAVLYCGRGLVQVTGETNYEKFGIADNPEKALELGTAVWILLEGMTKGMFTGRTLQHFINEVRTDYYNARRVVNGLDRATDISSYALNFEHLLKAL